MRVGLVSRASGALYSKFTVGNFDVFIMGVPSVKVLQIDGRHLYFLHSVHVWVGEQNGGTAGIGSRGYLRPLQDNLSQSG